eukprot:CAMPEP_0179138246 /NCGR_PEP_ID=MMETSP0796-20121207/66016_1 /TAXON_ID=73915 /ORGANISM="Pyrodinium bahamense, Strain pbaha01" /LENGTH=133 /DNA_ID=CAMNT_0020837521 /DNA_START=351 /DNA_END=749 /DNA_ORIENTATION=+
MPPGAAVVPLALGGAWLTSSAPNSCVAARHRLLSTASKGERMMSALPLDCAAAWHPLLWGPAACHMRHKRRPARADANVRTRPPGITTAPVRIRSARLLRHSGNVPPPAHKSINTSATSVAPATGAETAAVVL